MNECRKGSRSGEEDGGGGGVKRKARIGKTVLFCEMGSAEEKGRGDLSKNRPKSGSKWGRARKNGLRRAKNGSASSKIRPKQGSEWRKARKTEILGRKRWGGGEAKKWALLPILQCYEVAKLAQMKFSRIFFRRSLAGNAEMPYLCTRNREATLLQERVTL